VRRYWIDAQLNNESELTLRGDSFHHIIDVCRQGVGSKFELLTPEGKAYFVELIEVRKKEALAQIKEQREIPPLPTPRLHLAISVPKIPTLESVLEKAVEMGVSSIQPFFSDYSFFKRTSSMPQKNDRWQKIIVGATQQCGRGELLKLHDPIHLNDFLIKEDLKKDSSLCLFCYEGDSTLSIRKYLQSIPKEPITDIWFIIGSEGGFSLEEIQKLQQFNIKPLTLGQQILRVETACMTMMSILKYEWNLME
jgi:16S rRNA (uracil1498-N3)-methyltransferase